MRDQRTFMPLFVEHREAIWAFVRALVRDYHDCEDIFQQVSTILWEQFPRYRPGSSFAAWARAIALNKIRHASRARQRLVDLAPEALEVVLDAFDRLEHEETTREIDALSALRTCVEKLPRQTRSLVDLRYQQSLALREIADRLTTSVAAVNMKLTRIRKQLQQCIRHRLALEGTP